MKLAGDPTFRLVMALFSLGLVCVLGIFLGRSVRRWFMQPESAGDTHPEPEQLPMHTYHAVIQQLKQQKHELLSEQQSERRRARTSENISAAVLSHLSSGVVFLTPNGLVRQANTAAKKILGFASPIGLSSGEIFRDATIISGAGSQQELAATVQANLQAASQEKTGRQTLEAHYVTPGGAPRILEITMTAVHTAQGELLGAACLITDKTEVASIRKQQELRGEMSAEMALTLRSSLASISGYARQLAVGRDPERTQQLAAEIISEAAQLDHTIGGFLARARTAANAAGA